MKTHPLTKIQFVVAIFWGISLLSVGFQSEEMNNILSMSSEVAFLAMGLITVIIGYIMACGKELVIYPPESMWIRIMRKFRGSKAAEKLKSGYSARSRQRALGWLNIITGLLISFIAFAILIRS